MGSNRTSTLWLLMAATAVGLGCDSTATGGPAAMAGSSSEGGATGGSLSTGGPNGGPGSATAGSATGGTSEINTGTPGGGDSMPSSTGDPVTDAAVGEGDADAGATMSAGWRVLPNSPAGRFWNHDDVYFVDENRGWVCDISGTIWHTADGGDSWDKQVDQEGTSFRTLAFLDAQRGFVGTLGPGGWVDETQDDTLMYTTSDGGENWTPVTNIAGADALDGICGMVTVDSQTIYGVGRYDGPAGFIKTTDGGASWEAKRVDEADGLVDLHFFDANRGLLSGRRFGRSIILRTTDGGDTFTTVATSASDHIWKMYFRDDLHGYAMISNYSRNRTRFYLKTDDGGLSWSEVHYSPEVDEYEGLGIGFINEQLGWAAGGSVTYETRDGGETFRPVNLDPEGGDTINRFFRVNDTMYAVGARVYKYEIGATAAANVIPGTHSTAALRLAPGTFHGSGALTYTVPEPGPVSIGVVSVGGRLIESLVAETKHAGDYVLDYRPDYDQKFVRITMLAGDHRKSVAVARVGGGDFPKMDPQGRHFVMPQRR